MTDRAICNCPCHGGGFAAQQVRPSAFGRIGARTPLEELDPVMVRAKEDAARASFQAAQEADVFRGRIDGAAAGPAPALLCELGETHRSLKSIEECLMRLDMAAHRLGASRPPSTAGAAEGLAVAHANKDTVGSLIGANRRHAERLAADIAELLARVESHV